MASPDAASPFFAQSPQAGLRSSQGSLKGSLSGAAPGLSSPPLSPQGVSPVGARASNGASPVISPASPTGAAPALASPIAAASPALGSPQPSASPLVPAAMPQSPGHAPLSPTASAAAPLSPSTAAPLSPTAAAPLSPTAATTPISPAAAAPTSPTLASPVALAARPSTDGRVSADGSIASPTPKPLSPATAATPAPAAAQTPAAAEPQAATPPAVEEALTSTISVKALSKQLGSPTSSGSLPTRPSVLSPSSSQRPPRISTGNLQTTPSNSVGAAGVSTLASPHGATSGRRATSPALPFMATRSEHDSQNTTNAVQLLKLGAFKLTPLKDMVPYDELVKLRLEDGIDPTRKEDYLSDDDFMKVMGMNRDAYTKLPTWKRTDLKKRTFLF